MSRDGRSLSPEMSATRRRASSSEVMEWVKKGKTRLVCTPIPLGEGTEGTVYLATIVNTETAESKLVAAKKLHNYDNEAVAAEVNRHRVVTDASPSSAQGGVVKTFGQMSSVDKTGSPLMHRSSPAAASASVGNSPKQEEQYEEQYIVTSLCELSFKQLIPSILQVRNTPGYEMEYLKIVIDFMASMVNALKLFDAQNMVHRDIKPENVAILFDTETGSYVPVLLDCGGARSEKEIRENHGKILTFTPYYAAPEQMVLALDNYDVTDRLSMQKIDAFSIGMTLHELLNKRVRYIDDAGGEIKEVYPIVHQKKSLFLNAAKKTTQTPQQLEDEAISSQMNEIISWKNDANLLDCLGKMAAWLIETLPERRYSIDLLETALDRIGTIFLRQITEENSFEDISKWVNEFYEERVNEFRNKKQTSMVVDDSDDSLKTEVLDDNAPNLTAPRPAPIVVSDLWSNPSSVPKSTEDRSPLYDQSALSIPPPMGSYS